MIIRIGNRFINTTNIKSIGNLLRDEISGFDENGKYKMYCFYINYDHVEKIMVSDRDLEKLKQKKLDIIKYWGQGQTIVPEIE